MLPFNFYKYYRRLNILPLDTHKKGDMLHLKLWSVWLQTFSEIKHLKTVDPQMKKNTTKRLFIGKLRVNCQGLVLVFPTLCHRLAVPEQ